jgi:hypothetical protein
MSVQHCVFFQFRDDTPAEERAAVYADLLAMQDKIDGLDAIVHGGNTSFEGMSRGYEDGFIMTFRDRPTHLAYHEHDDHKAAGARLCDAVVNGVDGIFVFDFEG